MTTLSRKIALAVVAGLVAVTLTASPAGAANNFQNKIKTVQPFIDPGFADPGFVPPPSLPKFGFSSSNIGFGERVVNVRWGSLASQFGLERGDIILSMNGFPLNYAGSWTDALYSAMENGGVVRLRIRDVRTGYVVQRQLFLGDNGAPVDNYYKSNGNVNNYGSPNGPVTLKSTISPQYGNPSSKLIK